MAALNPDDAAHLMRRMAFGPAPGDIDNLVGMGREGAVDYLLNYQNIDNSSVETSINQQFDFTDPNNNTKFNDNFLKTWWLARMVFSKRQFEEKITLFWHNHFATALSKVPRQYMYIQNLTFRQNALGRFDTLLLKIAQDPAMLIWLDGITNVAAHANENFARELQELFTMGILNFAGQPNYTEDDVKQVARAFTGWNFHKRTGGGPYDYDFAVTANQHDNGQKTIYGQTANYTGDDVVAIISNRRDTPRFLVKKLFDFFVFPMDLTNPAHQTIADQFAQAYVDNDHSIKALVRAIFVSDLFFSDQARFALIKSPVEQIIGSIRMLGATYNASASVTQHDSSLYLASGREEMDIFNPPDVAGWRLNLGWISTATMLERFNTANTLVTTRPGNPSTALGAFLTTDQLSPFARPSAKKTVRNLLSVLGPLDVDGPTVRSLRNYLNTDDNGNQSDWDKTNSAMVDERLRGLIHLIMALPEYQLN